MRRRELQIKWAITNRVEESGPIEPYGSLIRGPVDLTRYLAPWAGEPQECVVLLALDARMKLIGHKEISRGDTSSCIMPLTALCRAAVMSGATAVILAHNHPSGDTTPSEADITVTLQAKAALLMLEIPLLDHVIVGIDTNGKQVHTSLRDKNLF